MSTSKGNETSIVVAGIEYSSIRTAISALKPKASENTIRQRLKYKGKYSWTNEEAFELVERERTRRPNNKKIDNNKKENNMVKSEVTVKGRTYPSVNSAASAYDVDVHLVYNRTSLARRKKEQKLQREVTEDEWNEIVEKAITTPLKVKPIVIDGVKYRSSNDAFNQLGKVKQSTFHSRSREGKHIKYCLGLVEDPEYTEKE